MNAEQLHKLFEDNPKNNQIAFIGDCHDCGKEVRVFIKAEENSFRIEGGAIYQPEHSEFYKRNEERYLKCDSCFGKEPKLTNYQKCEVYSRVVGYLRPVTQWNPGKQSEFKDRKGFKIDMRGGDIDEQ